MLNHVRSWLYVDHLSRPIVVLDGLPDLYGLKYDSATACGLALYLCSYNLVCSTTHGMIIKLAHIGKFPKGGLVLSSPSHPLDSLFLIVHLQGREELSNHNLTPIVLKFHNVPQPSLLHLGQ